MRCPKCGFFDSKVTDTRLSMDGVNIKRRRTCLSCGYKFATVERVVVEFPYVIKRSGEIVEFNENKIKKSLTRAMDKEQCSEEIIEKITAKILSRVLETKSDKISSQEIGAIILNELKSQYPVAYMRFASVYKNFKSANEFASECKLIDGEKNH
ncbi:MAG: transcriptional regulator NrdR [Puniceicoccales bacterium]|nr:transcriptional regulator NrdR [Puniceicoccales bacterium]